MKNQAESPRIRDGTLITLPKSITASGGRSIPAGTVVKKCGASQRDEGPHIAFQLDRSAGGGIIEVSLKDVADFYREPLAGG